MYTSRQDRPKQYWGHSLRKSWRFLLLCTLIGAMLGAVLLWTRPPVYEVQSVVAFDPQRYGFALQEGEGSASIDPLLLEETREGLSWQYLADQRGTEIIGQPVRFVPGDAPGTILAIVRATDAQRAYEIADHASQSLSASLRSMYGWNLLRGLLRREIYLQGQGRPEQPTALTPHLYALLEAGFLRYDPAFAAAPTSLTAQDVADVTLAMQQMEQRLTTEINQLFAQKERAGSSTEEAAVQAEVDRLIWQREILRETLITLYRQGSEIAQAENGVGGPQVLLSDGPPERPLGLPRWIYLPLGTAAGLLLGILLALFDGSLDLVGRLRELSSYGDLIWNLTMRDLKGRYKSSLLGYLWSLINPLLLMVVFTILFKFLLAGSIPNFPVFIIVALLPWNFCAAAVSSAVVSITGQPNLVKKVYFPREVIPIAVVLANLINFFAAMPAMVLIMVLLNAKFEWVALLFFLIALIQTMFLLGVAFLLSCLNVFFRDTQVIIEVFLTAWFFLTPIFYRLDDIVNERLARLVRWLNPMAALVDFYRDILYLGGMPAWDALIRTLITSLLVLLLGYLVFVRYSPRFGEEL
ncbi:MAG: ABC transporter permease [Chloroflexia bacterium]|nr:ABC transporter permease [Chloroflexia bacterium]